VVCRWFSLLLPAGKLIRIFADGDLCRIIDHKVQPALVKDVMTADCKTIYSGMLAAEVLQIMDSAWINTQPAVNAENELVGGPGYA
jgi:hypothetical protein